MNISPWQEVLGQFSEDANTNYNAAHLSIDRLSKINPHQRALIGISKEFTTKTYTYKELSEWSNQVANYLVSHGIRKEDRVFIYLPRIPEAVASFLGVLKTGAVAGTLFSAFEEKALLDRLLDSEARFVITTSDLFGRVKKAWVDLPHLEKVIVVGETAAEENVLSFTDVHQHSRDFDVIQTDLEDNAFMLYTSGSTGKPKGILHAHRALIQQYATFKEVFAPQKNDIYWCTADLGWITGVSYIVLGPLSHGVTIVLFEGRFNAHDWFTIMQDQKVNILYTAPTALRMLMASDVNPNDYDLYQLQTIGSVGEPLNPEAIRWGEEVFNKTILDTWFQTELGSICISNTAQLKVKPGSMGKPLPGITAEIVDENAELLSTNQLGSLVIKPNNPSIMKEVWKNPAKYQSYFKDGWYYTGDLAHKDADGYIFFNGRGDDIITTQGERVGPFEIESALIAHPLVIEAGVIGKPDELRGEIIKAFVVLSHEVSNAGQLIEELKHFVKDQLGGPLYPREIEFIESLPKTRSGKIMRRVLKARETGTDPGDLSSLENE